MDVQLEVFGTVEWLSHTRLALSPLNVRGLKIREECPSLQLPSPPHRSPSPRSPSPPSPLSEHPPSTSSLQLFSPSPTSSPFQHHQPYTSSPCSPAHKIPRLDFSLHSDSDETRLATPSPQHNDSDETRLPTPSPQHDDSDETRLPTPSPKHNDSDETRLPTPSPQHDSDETRLPTPSPQHNDSDETRLPTPSPQHKHSDETRFYPTLSLQRSSSSLLLFDSPTALTPDTTIELPLPPVHHRPVHPLTVRVRFPCSGDTTPELSSAPSP